MPGRPNTYIHYEISAPHTVPMPKVPLNLSAWVELLGQYLDQNFVQALVDIICYGAHIGYIGLRGFIKCPNLPIPVNAFQFLDEELEENLHLS